VMLLERGARDRAFFGNKAEIESLAASLASELRTTMVVPDEEHQAYAISVEDRSSGYPRHYRIDLDFVTTGEFRTLLGSYQDVRGVRGPMVVIATSQHDEEPPDEIASTDETTHGGVPIDPATRLAAEPKADARTQSKGGPGKGADVRLETLDELVEFFIDAGKKGIAVNRYKGLGEMNPETLWATTMKPESRTLLQVRAEDHTEADLMFTTLMGDQVEPRRKFIEENALDVKNLDV